MRSSFPDLATDLDSDVVHEYEDIEMRIPAQHRLGFDMTLQLQGDELHIFAGAFWLEWFPCTRSDVLMRTAGQSSAFYQASTGYVSITLATGR